MDPSLFRATLEHAGPAALGISFLAGLAFSINPVALAAIPVSMAYVTKARQARQACSFGVMFILGMLLTHGLLGLIAGLGGAWVEHLLGRQWGLFLGPLLILMGLLWPGWIRLPLPALALRARRPKGLWGAFALGIPFSVAVCPFCTPALAVLIGVAAASGSPWLGVGLLLAFAFGRAIPVAVGAWSLGWLQNLQRLDVYRRLFEAAGGITLILFGVYLLNGYYAWVPALAV